MPLDQTILNHIADLGYEVVVELGAVTAIDKQTGDRHRVTFDDGAESNLLSVTSRSAVSDRPAVSTRRIARDGSGWTFGKDR